MAFSSTAANENAARRRAILIAALGEQCMDCGSKEKLEFHHTEPREWVAANLNKRHRQLQYEKDWEAGVLILLCSMCNKRRGVPEFEPEYCEAVPF